MSSSESESSSSSEETGDVPTAQMPDPTPQVESREPVAQASSSEESETSSSDESDEEDDDDDEAQPKQPESQPVVDNNKSSSSDSGESESEGDEEPVAQKPADEDGESNDALVQKKQPQNIVSESESDESDSDNEVGNKISAPNKKLVSSDDSDSDVPQGAEKINNAQPDSAVTKKDVFGSDSDSSSSEDDFQKSKAAKKSTEYDIFGDLGDDMSSDDDGKAETVKEKRTVIGSDGEELIDDNEEGMDIENENENAAEANQEPVETQIAVDLPHIKVDLGKGIHFVKMPNFLSVETRPFDPQYYEDELIEDEVMDEEGRTRLKLKVENTMRWKIARDSEGNHLLDGAGNVMHESNTRIVKWSDGSMSLHLGKEIFDVHVMDTLTDYNHLFIRQGSGLQGQAIFRSKLTFRPHSTDSFTHRKITMSLADKSTKQQKVKVLPMVGKDPEANRDQLIKKEEEKLRASLRRENENRRRRERDTKRALTDNFLDNDNPNDVDDDNTISLTSIKNAVKKKRSVSAIYSSDDSDDDDSADSLSDTPVRKKARTKVLSEDEDDDDVDSDSGSGSGSGSD